MAVDKYINTEEKNLFAQNNSGVEIMRTIISFPVLIADGADSVYRFMKNINSLIPIQKITVMCSAITGADDNDIGYYKKNGGGVVDVDALMDGQTLVTASRVLDGMGAVAIADIGKRHYDIAGEAIAAREDEYDLALTVNTVASADGIVTIIVDQGRM